MGGRSQRRPPDPLSAISIPEIVSGTVRSFLLFLLFLLGKPPPLDYFVRTNRAISGTSVSTRTVNFSKPTLPIEAR